MKSGWFELPLAKTAPQIHPYRVAARSKRPTGKVLKNLAGSEARPRLGKSNWEKIAPQLPLKRGAAQLIGRSTAPRFVPDSGLAKSMRH